MAKVDDQTLWIHKPICLPLTLEAAYHRERAASLRAQRAKGLEPEADWAYFMPRCET